MYVDVRVVVRSFRVDGVAQARNHWIDLHGINARPGRVPQGSRHIVSCSSSQNEHVLGMDERIGQVVLVRLRTDSRDLVESPREVHRELQGILVHGDGIADAVAVDIERVGLDLIVRRPVGGHAGRLIQRLRIQETHHGKEWNGHQECAAAVDPGQKEIANEPNRTPRKPDGRRSLKPVEESKAEHTKETAKDVQRVGSEWTEATQCSTHPLPDQNKDADHQKEEGDQNQVGKYSGAG